MSLSHRLRPSPVVLAAAAVAAFSLLPSAGSGPAAAAARLAPTTRELVGQRFVVALEGRRPSAAILGRIRRGEIGGVILFGSNIGGAPQLLRLTAELQQAARGAGRPPLLIATDQEGGSVRRLPWAGPSASAPELGRASVATIRREAFLAGRALRAGGINVDLAPVADVPTAGSFMAAQHRTFGGSTAVVGRAVTSFVGGLAAADVAATVKHFPGIGRATRNTDRSAVEIGSSRRVLVGDLAPFRAAVTAGAPLVMISNATYPALDTKPAPWSPAVQALLRSGLGFGGVTISDALDGAAATRGRTLPSVAVLVARAGVDLLLCTGSEASSAAAFERVVAAADQGRLSRAALQRSYGRILSLKETYG